MELLFPIIHSANQLSIYRAVSSCSGQPGPNETESISEKFVTSEESFNAETLKSVSPQEEKLFGGFSGVQTQFWKQCAR